MGDFSNIDRVPTRRPSSTGRSAGGSRIEATSTSPRADLRALHTQRAALLEGLASICAVLGQGLDLDDDVWGAVGRRSADALEEMASAVEAELEEIENRLAEVRAGCFGRAGETNDFGSILVARGSRHG